MRSTPKFRRLPAIGSAAAFCLAAACMAAEPGTGGSIATGGAFEDVASLEALARAEATRQFPPLTERQRMLVGPIEPRVELEHCRQPVRAALTSARHMQDRATIELKCADAKPWHLYVQIRIIGTSSAAVAAHAIVSGTVIKASDLKVEQHDVSQLPAGFLDDPAIAVGLTAGRPISEGAFITNQQLMAAKAVVRGQAVTLLADAGGMRVRMAGKALSDGLVNQRIKVQNLSSGKIVEGVARSEQIVEIILD